ncbi:probable ATP-dependent RNA helicase DDX52 isoform X2 [Galleria mellonella]|uniref:Probable ATP-dependent RNA helicase DDX52 n=1 Tax=Galleria mellonella TaxID=7137 RepID=A0A6J3C2M5_GALME|nr:probable ATP-dependent RNA helicase DDX52 isoform X2 [Galleria mellonella]
MDAYDIFKKLTKGLTFKHRVLGIKNNEQPSKSLEVPKKEEIKVKTEEFIKDESDCSNNSDISESEGSDSENADIQLVDGVIIGEKKRKKKKKEKTEDLQKKLDLEEQNRFRNEHGIKVVGRHVPPALKQFSDLMPLYNVSPSLVDIVIQCGYTEPTPVQRQTLPCMLEDRQILACAPTGSGKTAAFLLPILHTLGAPQGGPRVLILCPTRELAHQIYREALRLSASTELRCSVVRNLKESKVKEREATIRKSDIVISTPNRLCYLLNQDNVNITLDKVRWLIIDEADKLFEGSAEQASDFRQQLDQIMSCCGSKQRRVAMFSATHTPAVAKWTRHNLRGLINITVGQRNAATNLVDQELLFCGNENGKLVAFRQLVQKGLKPPVLVFVQSKDRAKQLFKELIYDGINVDVIHADRTQAQRDNVVRSFRVGRIWILICTELMGRGIDFRGVNLVINYDFPPSAIAYIHRVGRAGRAGQRGRAITFFTQDDVVNLRSIASVMKQSGCVVPEYMLKLKQDPNKRKKLMKKAPRRDKISTLLEKPSKRKLESDKETEQTEKSKDAVAVKSSEASKLRKINNVQRNKNKTNQKKNINKSNNSKKRKKKVVADKVKKVKK